MVSLWEKEFIVLTDCVLNGIYQGLAWIYSFVNLLFSFFLQQVAENNFSNIVSQQARLVKRKGAGWKVQD